MTEPALDTNITQLEWQQVRSTINLLTLAVSQIECTMTDGEKSVAELTKSFSYIAEQISHLTDSSDEQAANNFSSQAQEIHNSIFNSIVAFQFYDRLSQRLDHVKRDLGWLSELVSAPNSANNPSAWEKLQNDIKSNYSMEEERLMFEHIMNGASVNEALEIYRHHFEKTDEDDSDDEVELF
ncbi:hypothetical protein A3715_11050 [Oleiphilus sp. HI0009]|nr:MULTISPECIES: hypothetical protein [unclassified Oleiphilus]KZX77750.1 hypothetical protein A3715_11050 [Oleiphilus sp. HI0009]KZY66461.1 hypothetical protein A3738_06285 [Oleiphilus sp. HI0066]KZY68977.1 hypothetical protein A3739_09900 [Oleiphilus sp. HI0067]